MDTNKTFEPRMDTNGVAVLQMAIISFATWQVVNFRTVLIGKTKNWIPFLVELSHKSNVLR